MGDGAWRWPGRAGVGSGWVVCSGDRTAEGKGSAGQVGGRGCRQLLQSPRRTHTHTHTHTMNTHTHTHRAANFTLEELPAVMSYLHARGVKVGGCRGGRGQAGRQAGRRVQGLWNGATHTSWHTPSSVRLHGLGVCLTSTHTRTHTHTIVHTYTCAPPPGFHRAQRACV